MYVLPDVIWPKFERSMESRYTIPFLVFAIFVLFFISKPLYFIQSNQYCQPKEAKSNSSSHRDGLESALSEASMANNKTLIIAVVNKAYVEGDKPMLDLFLDGFWLGEDTRPLVSHLLLVAVDQTSYDRCEFLHLHCYKLEEADDHGANFEAEKLYMSEDFIKMMWRRTNFLKELLKLGYSFVFTDMDVMWLRNPFPRLNNNNETIDLQLSADNFNGDEWSESNPINTGFYMVRSNNRTISLFENWYARKNKSQGLKEQDVLNSMMQEGVFRNLGLRVKFLDTNYFSGFCEVSKDFNSVTTVHANCCRTISAKVADLTAVVHDWKRFKSSNSNQTSGLKWTYHSYCENSWKT